jgi:hypothetical protein
VRLYFKNKLGMVVMSVIPAMQKTEIQSQLGHNKLKQKGWDMVQVVEFNSQSIETKTKNINNVCPIRAHQHICPTPLPALCSLLQMGKSVKMDTKLL